MSRPPVKVGLWKGRRQVTLPRGPPIVVVRERDRNNEFGDRIANQEKVESVDGHAGESHRTTVKRA